jgi:hypothetical protein
VAGLQCPFCERLCEVSCSNGSNFQHYILLQDPLRSELIDREPFFNEASAATEAATILTNFRRAKGSIASYFPDFSRFREQLSRKLNVSLRLPSLAIGRFL